MTRLSNSNSDSDSSSEPTPSTEAVCVEVWDERLRQDARWGEQNHLDGTNLSGDYMRAEEAKKFNDWAVDQASLTFRDILYEEVLEAFAEDHPDRLRAELIQVAAVAVAWVEAIDRRTA